MSYFYSKKYLRWDLQFIDKELETGYARSKEKHQHFFLNLAILFGFLFGIIAWVLNPFNRGDRFKGKILAIRIVLFVIMAIFFAVGHKKPKCREPFLIIIVLMMFFALMENGLENRQNWNDVMFFLTGMNIELIILPLVLGKISWKISISLFALINLMNSFRYTSFERNKEMNFYPFYQFLQNSIILGLSAYFVEKIDRESFYRIKSYEFSLSRYRDLITNIFPSAIVVLIGKEVVFYNKETLTVLECLGEEEIINVLDKLKLEELRNTQQGGNFETEESKPLNKKHISFEDFILKTEKEKFTENNHLYGVYEINGKRKNFEIKTTHIVWEDEKAFMIIISESRVFEKINIISEQSEYKDKLLATVSHDLRTPLNGIIGMIRMVLEIISDSVMKKYLRVALRSCNLLLMMINDILDYSQISNNKLRLTLESFNIWDVIKDVSKLFKFQAKLKGLKFIKENFFSCSRDAYTVVSDQNRLKQILFNLLGNALKFTVKGWIKITLKNFESTENILSKGKKTEKGFYISVEDTGVGIKKEDQKNLFQMFGKIHNENSKSLNKSGVGLGLSISQTLVKMLNHDRENSGIILFSEVNKGSCFSFVLCSQKNEDYTVEGMFSNFTERSENDIKRKAEMLQRKLDRDFKIKQEKKTKHLKKILLVDDDQISIIVATSYLKTIENIEFDAVFNGEDAIRTIKAKAKDAIFYDVILMDCNMPGMDGFEAASLISQMIFKGEIPFTNIIACTANVSSNNNPQFINCGIVDSLIKPFSKEELKKKLDLYN